MPKYPSTGCTLFPKLIREPLLVSWGWATYAPTATPGFYAFPQIALTLETAQAYSIPYTPETLESLNRIGHTMPSANSAYKTLAWSLDLFNDNGLKNHHLYLLRDGAVAIPNYFTLQAYKNTNSLHVFMHPDTPCESAHGLIDVVGRLQEDMTLVLPKHDYFAFSF